MSYLLFIDQLGKIWESDGISFKLISRRDLEYVFGDSWYNPAMADRDISFEDYDENFDDPEDDEDEDDLDDEEE